MEYREAMALQEDGGQGCISKPLFASARRSIRRRDGVIDIAEVRFDKCTRFPSARMLIRPR